MGVLVIAWQFLMGDSISELMMVGLYIVSSTHVSLQTLRGLPLERRSRRNSLYHQPPGSYLRHQPSHCPAPFLQLRNWGWERPQHQAQHSRGRARQSPLSPQQPRSRQEQGRHPSLQPEVLPRPIWWGSRNPLPQESSCFFIQEHGGACIAKTKTFYIIGTFNTELAMANKVPQNPGELNKRVETLAANLTKQGYWLNGMDIPERNINGGTGRDNGTANAEDTKIKRIFIENLERRRLRRFSC